MRWRDAYRGEGFLSISGKTGERLHLWEGTAGQNFGWAVAWAGDVNGDGRDDVIVGAPGSGPAKGHVYVYSGRDGERILELEGESAGDLFGREIWGIGDVDGDGAGDVIVGAPQNDGAGTDAGRAYVYSGASGEELHRIDGDQAGDKYGSAVTGTASGCPGPTVTVVPFIQERMWETAILSGWSISVSIGASKIRSLSTNKKGS